MCWRLTFQTLQYSTQNNNCKPMTNKWITSKQPSHYPMLLELWLTVFTCKYEQANSSQLYRLSFEITCQSSLFQHQAVPFLKGNFIFRRSENKSRKWFYLVILSKKKKHGFTRGLERVFFIAGKNTWCNLRFFSWFMLSVDGTSICGRTRW